MSVKSKSNEDKELQKALDELYKNLNIVAEFLSDDRIMDLILDSEQHKID